MFILATPFLYVRGLVSDRVRLAAENLALRQQLAVLNRRMPRPRTPERRPGLLGVVGPALGGMA